MKTRSVGGWAFRQIQGPQQRDSSELVQPQHESASAAFASMSLSSRPTCDLFGRVTWQLLCVGYRVLWNGDGQFSKK